MINIMQNLDALALGFIGGGLYILMSYYLYQTVLRLNEDSETALTQLFLHDKTKKAFKVFTASTILTGLTYTVKYALDTAGMEVLAKYMVVISVLWLPGYLYFFYIVYDVTRKNTGE